ASAAGAVCRVRTILLAGLSVVEQPSIREVVRPLQQLTSLTSGLSFFVGFAPPSLLRRAWQEPELRAFLGRAASLPRLPDTRSIVRALERGAATSSARRTPRSASGTRIRHAAPGYPRGSGPARVALPLTPGGCASTSG